MESRPEITINLDIVIKEAEEKHVNYCVSILQNTMLGTVYFSDYKKTADLLLHALAQRGLFVALKDQEECLGFMYCMPKGVFGSYPYLHIIAVEEKYRNLGIGKQLIKYFEENSSGYSSTKYFLTVDDFNPQARKLYESLGYQCVGELKDFYKDGITSYIMMKATGKQPPV
ncbi:MAG: GNAT family N-acetyltransferase [Oscillospiraceae bacterium]|nr:GNAT family N-acetyltransferase [Oscillospiraceae bacterium]